MLQVDGPQEDDNDDADEDEEDDDCEKSSVPIAAASSVIQLVCLGCRHESGLAKNLKCNICSEKLKLIFYGRHIQFVHPCKTDSNKRIKCPKCNEDEWEY